MLWVSPPSRITSQNFSDVKVLWDQLLTFSPKSSLLCPWLTVTPLAPAVPLPDLRQNYQESRGRMRYYLPCLEKVTPEAFQGIYSPRLSTIKRDIRGSTKIYYSTETL